ncbi:MAG: hypothetical protein DWI10_10745, partial [Planctomycetota bacterium]
MTRTKNDCMFTGELTLALAACVAVLSLFTLNARAQDECSSAIDVLPNAPTAFNTIVATPSANPPSDSLCSDYFLQWGNSKDVWLRYTPSTDGLATFTTCSVGSYDTSIALYSGVCGSLAYLACNGDTYDSAGCQPYHSEIRDYEVDAGTTYYIRIGGFEGATGIGALTVRESTVAVWGENTDGEWRVPATLGVVKQLAAGGRHLVALQANDALVCWGDNTSGQCNAPAGLTDSTAIAAGDAHSLALRANGEVVCWGRNTNGQCNVPGALSAKAIAGGGYHSIAVRTTGAVVGWGSNTYG